MPWANKADQATYHRQYYLRTKEAKLAKNAEWHKQHKERTKRIVRKSLLKRKFGITEDDVEQMKLAQAGRCACCGDPLVTAERESCIDHCHTTGKVRGILCGSCNKMIGFAYDNPWRLRAAASYLER